ncbi:unnamed protein product [Chondrus crispus]|uniref:Uncharacterized protein n=1 Tax=Chondrus crispus TaxID=2769 RepID=R7Q2S0_CHOCR|nr:unnamed protein product [Chondrus crispus]CDF32867.1 unnamed protein product [Chondrus crispus]|eukprot:XP_005712668.1 unnamed protein product [Chondrus crispus]
MKFLYIDEELTMEDRNERKGNMLKIEKNIQYSIAPVVPHELDRDRGRGLVPHQPTHFWSAPPLQHINDFRLCPGRNTVISPAIKPGLLSVTHSAGLFHPPTPTSPPLPPLHPPSRKTRSCLPSILPSPFVACTPPRQQPRFSTRPPNLPALLSAFSTYPCPYSLTVFSITLTHSPLVSIKDGQLFARASTGCQAFIETSSGSVVSFH